LPALVDDIHDWLDGPTNASEYARLRARISTLKPQVDRDLQHLQLASLLLRLEELVDRGRTAAPQHAIDHGTAPLDRAHYRIRTERVAADKHADYGMALFSALSAGVALMSYWWGSRWVGKVVATAR
jgi:hypothetical protein